MKIKLHNINCMASVKLNELPTAFKAFLDSIKPTWATPEAKDRFYPVAAFINQSDESYTITVLEVLAAIGHLLDTTECDYIQFIED